MLVSYQDKKRNDELSASCQDKYDEHKPVTFKGGKKHQLLRMILDIERTPVTAHTLKEDHVKDLIDTFPEEVKGKSPALSGEDLFAKGVSGLFSQAKKEAFHTCIAKGFFKWKSNHNQRLHYPYQLQAHALEILLKITGNF